MYRHIDRHIKVLLDLLRKDEHVRDYDNLMHEFAQADTAVDSGFQQHYVHFWRLRGVNDAWRRNCFTLLQDIRNQGERELRQLLRHVCHETLGNRRGRQSLEFSFATKLVHMVDPRSPIYDANVRAFYFLPDANGGDIEARTDGCLKVYDALVREYDRILENRLLDESIARFRGELNPETFTDIKVIDSLIWAFVTWAKRGPAFVKGGLQYE
jgi:hypothetical protein